MASALIIERPPLVHVALVVAARVTRRRSLVLVAITAGAERRLLGLPTLRHGPPGVGRSAGLVALLPRPICVGRILAANLILALEFETARRTRLVVSSRRPVEPLVLATRLVWPSSLRRLVSAARRVGRRRVARPHSLLTRRLRPLSLRRRFRARAVSTRTGTVLGRAGRAPLGRLVDMDRLHQRRQLALGQIPRVAEGEVADAERADSHPAQPFDWDADRLHHPAHEVVHPLVNRDRQDDALARLPQQAHFLRDNGAAFDHDAVAQPLQRLVRRAAQRENLIFLCEPVFRVHNAIGDIAVVREEQQPFRVAIEPSNRVDPLWNVDQLHHGPAVALILDGRDVAAWLVEDEVAHARTLDWVAVDEDDRLVRVRLRPELRHDLAVDADAAGGDQFFGGAAGGDASGGENALQSFHGGVEPSTGASRSGG